MIRCNNCMNVMSEENLVVINEIEFCPHCYKDGCLMDLEAIKTIEYFNKNIDELLLTYPNGWTLEEKLIDEIGELVVWCDDEQELIEEMHILNEYTKQDDYYIKQILLTINERIAVVLDK